MPPKADPAWGMHTQDVTKEELKGGIRVSVKGWKCWYCSKCFYNKNVKRLLVHLCGDRIGRDSGSAELCSEETNPISEETTWSLNLSWSARRRSR